MKIYEVYGSYSLAVKLHIQLQDDFLLFYLDEGNADLEVANVSN
jgi:hypothetical protein